MKIPIPMIFYITTPDRQTALDLAKDILDAKIAACANIIENVTSLYWWEGKIQNEPECMMILKTTNKLSQKLIQFIQKHHPYEVPECIGINITVGSEPYLQWILDSTLEE